MTESQLTAAMRDALRDGLPGARLILKHCDRYTAGLADVTVTWNGRTSWLEEKFLRERQSLTTEIKEHQLLFMRAAAAASGGRAWFVVWKRVPRRKAPITLIWHPSAEAARRGDGVDFPRWESLVTIPAARLAERLRSEPWDRTPFAFEGISHAAVVELIKETHR